MRSWHVPRPLAALLLGLAVLAAPAAGAPARAGPIHVRDGALQAPPEGRAGGAGRDLQRQCGGVPADDPPRWRPHRLDRDDVVRRLRWAGYANISCPEYRRGGYVARVDDPFGNRRLLQVDPHTGVIRRLRETRRPWW